MKRTNPLKAPGSRGKIDISVLIIVLLIIAFGLLMLFSASFYYGQSREGDGYYYIKQQLRGVIVGAVAMWFFSFVDYKTWAKPKVALAIYLGCMALLLACFVPGIAMPVNEAHRWINLGFTSFQPGEISKFGIILVISSVISRYKPGNMQKFWTGVFPILLLVGGICAILYMQPNFSMLSMILICAFAMLFIAGMKWSQIIIMGVLGLTAGGLLMISEPYRLDRVRIFLDPFSPQLAEMGVDSFQLRQSLYAIGSGGAFGTGLGQSRQKYLFLPLGESDFIFSIIAEELGLIGCIVVMLAFLFLIWQGYRIAWKCPDRFGRLVAAGITTIIGLQTFINIAVATSSMPSTGVPLPFISYGSTALMCFMAAVGILLSVSRSTTTSVMTNPSVSSRMR